MHGEAPRTLEPELVLRPLERLQQTRAPSPAVPRQMHDPFKSTGRETAA
jgi:hypothetical protein